METHRLSDYNISELERGKSFISKILRDHINLNFDSYVDQFMSQIYSAGDIASSDNLKFNFDFTISAGLLLSMMKKKSRRK